MHASSHAAKEHSLMLLLGDGTRVLARSERGDAATDVRDVEARDLVVDERPPRRALLPVIMQELHASREGDARMLLHIVESACAEKQVSTSVVICLAVHTGLGVTGGTKLATKPVSGWGVQLPASAGGHATAAASPGEYSTQTTSTPTSRGASLPPSLASGVSSIGAGARVVHGRVSARGPVVPSRVHARLPCVSRVGRAVGRPLVEPSERRAPGESQSQRARHDHAHPDLHSARMPDALRAHTQCWHAAVSRGPFAQVPLP